MNKPTTTTRRRQPASVQPATLLAPTIDELQRAALALAEAQGWRVEVEARDGTRARLRLGRPAAALVITLAPSAGNGLAELYP